MKKILPLLLFILACLVSKADIQFAENLSFETTSGSEAADWWNYNDGTSGSVGLSSNWYTDGSQSVKLELDANADPVWVGVGQGIDIIPESGTDLRRLYIAVNIKAVRLQNAHVKLEAKLLKEGASTEYEYAVIKEDKVLEEGEQTLSLILDARELPQSSGEYSVVIGVVLGSEFTEPSRAASGCAYVDEVYALGTFTRKVPTLSLNLCDIAFEALPLGGLATKVIFDPGEAVGSDYQKKPPASIKGQVKSTTSS